MKAIVHVGLIFLCAASVAGCSLSLGGLTTLDETRARRQALINPDQLKKLDHGTAVRIRLADGAGVTGDYISVRQVSNEQVIELNAQGRTVLVPIVEVERIERRRKNFSIWPAFVFGGAIDAVILVIFFTTDIGPGGIALNF